MSEAGSREGAIEALIEAVVEAVYAEGPETEYVEVTYADGLTEVLHVRDFASGAMLANIVDRAKKFSIKDQLAGRRGGISRAHVLAAVEREIRENAELPSTTNPEEWARASGRRGERVVQLRALMG